MATVDPTLWDAKLKRLPRGWGWQVTRVIHCMPDDQVDGWRVLLSAGESQRIEVTHRNLDHARVIALEAAGELWPDAFPQWSSVKKGP